MNGLKLRYLLDDLAPLRGRMLDIGCGAGAMARAVADARPDLEVHGCDLSRPALAAAATQPDRVRLLRATAAALPYGDAVFDAALMMDVLEHLDDPGRALAEAARVLLPGGTLHVVLPLEGQPGTLYRLPGTGGRWRAKRRHTGHVQAFSARAYRDLAAACGLPVTRTRWSYHLLFQLGDLAYYSWLDRRGPAQGSIEDTAARCPGPAGGALRALVVVAAALGWFEARLLRALPGGCGHFTSRRLP
jgi:SAM-dependent methyltransferase